MTRTDVSFPGPPTGEEALLAAAGAECDRYRPTGPAARSRWSSTSPVSPRRGIALNPREHDGVRVLPLAQGRTLMPPRGLARLSAVEEAGRTGEAAYFGTWEWGNE
ncbi:hypothetical protein MBT84_37535 [Streptomyces sp. MBT84]|uniref:hypothetical protein n=1 Tax=Streptomyces sp. MBT84 TaxID=1488414 RepID=UPI001C6F530E|nr:hypothetical protein [Streptomyces sp. MBT84]MBW8705319.1 hypothetical protein [Streptomyces sp. MBT84]